ncbi:L-shaped tail fiber [Gossypium australe]|uniref:L-shaped tail fiber n=1 Tax=Gossypium australe TaxID=47621 RepID=A0A5B6VNA2_9ROSI|nr:L-shaped tail fiber [Gossypium australe]
MALIVTLSHGSSSGGGNRVRSLCNKPSKHFYPRFPPGRHVLFPVSPRTLHLTSAAKNLTTKEQDEEKRTPEIKDENVVVGIGLDNVGVSSSKVSADGKPFPELPGLQLDLWEGTKWDVLGFLVQYLWAFGIVFAVSIDTPTPAF